MVYPANSGTRVLSVDTLVALDGASWSATRIASATAVSVGLAYPTLLGKIDVTISVRFSTPWTRFSALTTPSAGSLL